jgi:hypothetical protein
LSIVSVGFSTTEDIYSINTMVISGDLANNVLSFRGSGNVLNGENVKVYLLGPISDIVITELKVNGLNAPVSFDGNGYFFMADSSFDFSGSFSILSLGQLSLSIPGPVKELSFELVNGYVVGASKRYSQLNNIIIIQRQEVEQVLVSGDFHYIFDELRNDFVYEIDFNSLGDSLSSYTLLLKNAENIQSVVGVLDYNLIGNELILELIGSEAHVLIYGTFNSSFLRLPINEGVHNVLIESHPEKKLSISTNAEVIDLSESSIAPKYYNSQSFLADYSDYFSINLEDLTLLPSLTFSVRNAQNKVAISEKGTILGQLSYNYANSGEEYIKLSVPGTPLYSAINRNSVMLTQENDSLFLAIPKTNYGTLDVTYLTQDSPLSIFSIINIPIINSSMPISEMSTRVYLPEKYFVLWTFGADYGQGTEIPSAISIVIFISVTIILGFLLNKNKSFIIQYMIIMLGISFLDLGLLAAAYLASCVLIIKNRVNKKDYLKYSIIGAVALVAIFIVYLVFNSSLFSSSLGDYSYSGSVESSSQAPIFEGIDKVSGNQVGGITITTEKGVMPVDFSIPRMGKTVQLTTNLVTLENKVSYSMILINSDLKYLFAIISAVLIFNVYKKFLKK